MSKLLVEISPDHLDLQRYTGFVADPGAGATATFSGTTRDTFQGKKVVQLEYEAYEPMAKRELEELAAKAHARWSLRHIAVAHRIGIVPILEPSVIIAISSAHRRDSLEACAWFIDELKATVPIWKKELYEGGEVWKENAESRKVQSAATPPSCPANLQHT